MKDYHLKVGSSKPVLVRLTFLKTFFLIVLWLFCYWASQTGRDELESSVSLTTAPRLMLELEYRVFVEYPHLQPPDKSRYHQPFDFWSYLFHDSSYSVIHQVCTLNVLLLSDFVPRNKVYLITLESKPIRQDQPSGSVTNCITY